MGSIFLKRILKISGINPAKFRILFFAISEFIWRNSSSTPLGWTRNSASNLRSRHRITFFVFFFLKKLMFTSTKSQKKARTCGNFLNFVKKSQKIIVTGMRDCQLILIVFFLGRCRPGLNYYQQFLLRPG